MNIGVSYGFEKSKRQLQINWTLSADYDITEYWLLYHGHDTKQQ